MAEPKERKSSETLCSSFTRNEDSIWLIFYWIVIPDWLWLSVQCFSPTLVNTCYSTLLGKLALQRLLSGKWCLLVTWVYLGRADRRELSGTAVLRRTQPSCHGTAAEFWWFHFRAESIYPQCEELILRFITDIRFSQCYWLYLMKYIQTRKNL